MHKDFLECVYVTVDRSAIYCQCIQSTVIDLEARKLGHPRNAHLKYSRNKASTVLSRFPDEEGIKEIVR